MRRIPESFFILILSFFLLLGFIFLEGNILSLLVRWKTNSQENTPQRWVVLREMFGYAANNVFNKGYFREVGPEVHHRLLVYPQGTILEKGLLVVPKTSSETIVKLSLPKGFKDGLLTMRVTAETKHSIGVSSDLKIWKFYDYPGLAAQIENNLSLKKEDLADGRSSPCAAGSDCVFLKFLPSRDDNLNIYFDIFQYTSDSLSDQNEYYGIFSPPDEDIDYKGEKVFQPGLIYDNRKSKTNN